MATQQFWQENVTVYLIHLDRPLHHARHYIGSTTNLPIRLRDHRNGNGSAMMAAVARAGIGWTVTRTWENVPRWFEAKLHRRHETPKFGPVCQKQY